jgi:hypothetical protein
MNIKKICHLPRGILYILPLLLLANPMRADLLHFQATLSGPAESPPNISPGTGVVDVFFDDTAQTMQVIASFSDLLGTTTASHIHAATALPDAGTAGVATQTPTFTGFPLGVTSGTYDHIFDLTLTSSFSNAYVTNNGGTAASASNALKNALLADKAYYNIHTTQYGGGEIRGFLHNVPDTSTTALLLAAALGGVACFVKARRMCAV